MEDWLKIFKALSDETRLKILELLFSYGFCVGALARLIGISEAAVSQHIRILREAGLLIGQKRGGYTYYEPNSELMKRISDQIVSILEKKPERRECGYYLTGEHQYCEIYAEYAQKKKYNMAE